MRPKKENVSSTPIIELKKASFYKKLGFILFIEKRFLE